MPVQSSEIKTYRSSVVSDGPANGGIMSSIEAVSGVASNLFANASALDRANGATQWRKLFLKVANAANSPLLNPRIWLDDNTEGMDRVTFIAATQRNTQGSITGSEAVYGMGVLAPGAAAGASSISVEVEHGATPIFANGRLVRISNKATPLAAGDEFWVRINQAPSVVGNIVTLHLESPLPVSFLSGAKVSSVYEAGDIAAVITAPSVSSAAGTVASSWEDKATVNGIGCVEQSWTLSFSSPTAFDIVGDTLGVVGAGNVSGGASPLHPFGYPYFTLLPALFGGTYAQGDTITFVTHPAAAPVFMRRVIPAGTVAVSNNHTAIYIDGETN